MIVVDDLAGRSVGDRGTFLFAPPVGHRNRGWEKGQDGTYRWGNHRDARRHGVGGVQPGAGVGAGWVVLDFGARLAPFPPGCRGGAMLARRTNVGR